MSDSRSSRRFVVGLAGTELSPGERRLLRSGPPFGVLLLARNLVSPEQAFELVSEVRALADPPPLLFVDQEGGPVDRLGPLLGVPLPSPEACAARGAQETHDAAYLMGRAARMLGFDADFAPAVDLAQPGAGARVLAGRCFGFHAEDVIVAGTVFLHGLARAGVASCLKHFPGLGRGAVDSHQAPPRIDAHDVDLMVTDVAPFAKLCRGADGVMVGHAIYPDLLGGEVPASLNPRAYALLRERLGFSGVTYSDELSMEALTGSLAERAVLAATAGCDVLIATGGLEGVEPAIARVGEAATPDPAREARLAALANRCAESPRPGFGAGAWKALAAEAATLLEALERPRPAREELPGWG